MNEILDINPETLESIQKFNQYLGPRFKSIEVGNEGAPITILTKDKEDKEYYIRLVNHTDNSINDILQSGISIENTVFYQLYALVTNSANVFHMEMFKDGYALWFLNDLSPEQIKVVGEDTYIGITSVLHLEDNSVKLPTTKIKSYYDNFTA
jgi:hypothetical protein